MTVSFSIPPSIESLLSEHGQDPNLIAKQAALIELYRQTKVTRVQLASALGLSRFETDALLKRHNVTEDLGSPAEYQSDLDAVRDTLKP